MKVITWVMVALLVAGAAFMAVRPAQGCTGAHPAHPVTHVQPTTKPAPAPRAHPSFVIAARMGWL